MPIPALTPEGVLPIGDHDATLAEVEAAFGISNYGRRKLCESLARVVERLREAGIVDIWVDGSFTTAKQSPRDVDLVYVHPAHIDPTTWPNSLAPARRPELKKNMRVDLLVGAELVELFRHDKRVHPAIDKGIIKLAES